MAGLAINLKAWGGYLLCLPFVTLNAYLSTIPDGSDWPLAELAIFQWLPLRIRIKGHLAGRICGRGAFHVVMTLPVPEMQA